MFTYLLAGKTASVRANTPEEPLNQGGIAAGGQYPSLHATVEQFRGTFYMGPHVIPLGIEPQGTLGSNLLINTQLSAYLFQRSHLHPSPCLCFFRKSN